MNEFSVGDSVRTTVEWSQKWSHEAYHGKISRISSTPNPGHPDRTICVKLSEPSGEFSSVWFAPYDLEMDE